MESVDCKEAALKFQRLVEIMARLRSPQGCPWDRQQTFDSIKPYLLEETYEVLDAIERRDWNHLAEELGDLMLQCVFFAQMAAEQGHFTIEDSLEAISSKLMRRHPHVFGKAEAKTPEEVKARWDEIKRQENQQEGRSGGLLAGVPRCLPALMEAQQLTSKAATVGFDWKTPDQVLDKLHEELKELAEAREKGEPDAIFQEIGDLLFVLVNLARLLKVDAEQALRATNAKFRERFAYVERRLSSEGRSLEDATLAEMDCYWEEAKQK